MVTPSDPVRSMNHVIAQRALCASGGLRRASLILIALECVDKKHKHPHTRDRDVFLTPLYGSVLPTFVCATLHFSGLEQEIRVSFTLIDYWIFDDERRSATRPDHMPPPIVRARRRIARLPEDVVMSAAGEETSSMDVPALTRQQALGPLLSRVVNDEDLAVLSVILEQMDDLDDVARLRQTCRVLRDGVDACMKMKRMVAVKRQERLKMDEDMDMPRQLMAWKKKWTRNPWVTWVARGDMRRERPDMTRALSRCNLAAVQVGRQYRDETLLHVASYYGHAGMVMLLLGCGVDKDEAKDDGQTPLYIASEKGHLEIVRLLVDAGADKEKADDGGRTPLFVACQEGHLEIVRLLVDAGADMDKACGSG